MDEEDKKAFLNAMRGVKPLKDHGLAPIHKKKITIKKRNTSRQSQTSEVPISKINKTQNTDSHYNTGLDKRTFSQLQNGKLRPQAEVDLHGCTTHQATQLLQTLFHESLQYDYRVLLIIHGKGLHSNSEGVLKQFCRHWLRQQNEVLAFCPASEKDGGYGASYVYVYTN